LQFHAILTEGNPVAVFQDMVFDPLVVDESSVRALKILKEVPLIHPDDPGVVPRHVRVVQDDVRVALSSDEYLGIRER
jgi:hypothetical protein